MVLLNGGEGGSRSRAGKGQLPENPWPPAKF